MVSPHAVNAGSGTLSIFRVVDSPLILTDQQRQWKVLYSLNSARRWVGMLAVAKRARSDRQYLPSMRSTNPRGSPYQLPPVGIPMV
jgi:hypothetical protein